MDLDGEVHGENTGRLDMTTLTFENASTSASTGNPVMFVSQTHTATTTMSIVYANANDTQSSAIYSGCGGDISMIAGPNIDYNSSDLNFDWDSDIGNYVIQDYADPAMQTMIGSTLDGVSPSSCKPQPQQHGNFMEAAPGTLLVEQVPMTYQGNPAADMRQFDYIPPEMPCSVNNSAAMAETFPTIFVTEPCSNSTSFGSSGSNRIFTDSLTSSPQNAAYQQMPSQTSSDQQKDLYSNLPLFEPENINATRNCGLMFNVQPEFGCQSQRVTNIREGPCQREMNCADIDHDHHSFLTQVYNQVLQSIKTETEDDTGIAVRSQETPPQTQREMIEDDRERDYNRILGAIKVEMEGDTNITVNHQLGEFIMQGNPPQGDIYQANSFSESEYNQILESVKAELGNDVSITVEHQTNQSPMNFDFSGTPPIHQSQQAPLESQEILGRTFATFDIGDSSDSTRQNLFVAPTPYSPQMQVNSPNGSYSDSGFSSSQFSSQDVFSSQETDNTFTTKELHEAYDEVDGSPPMVHSGPSQNVSMMEVYYSNPMSVPVPTASDYNGYQNDNRNTSDEDDESHAFNKRGSRKASKRSRNSRPGGRRAAGTSNSECGSSDGDCSTGGSATQRPSAGGSQRVRRVRVKEDVSSFRHQMGPHLRTLSAVLEMSGLKMVHELVPYEVIRRFHPTDVYRTISRSVNFMENFGTGDSSSTASELQPDWEKFVAESNGGIITTQEPSNERIYYKSPFGRPEEEGEKEADVVILAPKEPCTLSIRSEAEINGRLAQSPEVKTGVGSAELNVKLNLHKVAERCTNVEFKQSELYDRPLIMRLKNPQSIAMVYDTGKLIVIGTKSYDEFRVAVRRFARMVQKTGVDVQLTQLKMHFYIGLFILPFDINVNAMRTHDYVSKFLMHDLSIFPGVIIKLPNNPMLCLVFETGAVIFTNVVQVSNMKETLDLLYPTLRLFGHQQ